MLWRTLALYLLWALAAITGYFCEVTALITACLRVHDDRAWVGSNSLAIAEQCYHLPGPWR